MNSVSIVSKRIMRIMSVSLAYHGKKREFLNSFVSLTRKRIIRIMFVRVCLFNYLAIFKRKKIIIRPAKMKRGEWEKRQSPIRTNIG
jgi:hypothetical protein